MGGSASVSRIDNDLAILHLIINGTELCNGGELRCHFERTVLGRCERAQVSDTYRIVLVHVSRLSAVDLSKEIRIEKDRRCMLGRTLDTIKPYPLVRTSESCEVLVVCNPRLVGRRECM